MAKSSSLRLRWDQCEWYCDLRISRIRRETSSTFHRLQESISSSKHCDNLQTVFDVLMNMTVRQRTKFIDHSSSVVGLCQHLVTMTRRRSTNILVNQLRTEVREVGKECSNTAKRDWTAIRNSRHSSCALYLHMALRMKYLVNMTLTYTHIIS